MTAVYILLGLILLAGVYFGSTYNRLVRARAMVEEGWSGVEVQLKKRYNLIPNLIETVKGYAAHEQDTLNKVIAARNAAQGSEGVAEQQAAEQQLTSALSGFFALAEAYPDLKANQNFLHLQGELSKIEGDIEKARRYYNGTVRENNILVESFPSNLVAGLFKFYLSEFFETENDEERTLPQVKF
jgi:LemA protein